MARELGRKLEYIWRTQRRGFFRNTLNAERCDLVMGVPSGFEMVLTTCPYYRSAYAPVYRKNAGYTPHSLIADRIRAPRKRRGTQMSRRFQPRKRWTS